METRECMENANEKSQYGYGTLKRMEEKPFFRMGYLRLFFTIYYFLSFLFIKPVTSMYKETQSETHFLQKGLFRPLWLISLMFWESCTCKPVTNKTQT